MANADGQTGGTPAGQGDGLDSKSALRLWLRLYRSVAEIEREVRSRLLRQYGVSLSRFDVMAALHHADEALTMGQLSDRLLVSNGNVTGLISRLVDDGLALREVGETDRRVQTVCLTAEGKTQFERFAEAHETWLAEILGDMPPETADLLSTHLDDMMKHVRLNPAGERNDA